MDSVQRWPKPSSPPLRLFASVEEYVERLGGKRVIKKVLIANNGIAAVKGIRFIRRWAYEMFGDDKAVVFVAMATPDDIQANAEYIRMADQFVEVPGGSNNNNYANVDLIVTLASENGCQAVWAGWGHASENPRLPKNLLAKGITFIGPHERAMDDLGDKINSTLLAQTAGVSVVPWSGSGIMIEYDGTKEQPIPEEIQRKATVATAEEAIQALRIIGYPAMMKASEGGGGKGIRKVTCEEDVETAFRSIQGEVPGNRTFIMKLVSNAHHLEVQVIADEHGNAISIYGRDCTVQRRHQKIIEEGPPIIADSAIFEKMEKGAVRLAKIVNYVGAGTVEYLYSPEEQNYYFLELNPRLQVEHPVSERISGVNLPATQLNIAMGIPLYRIPDIRRLYNHDPFGDSVIDFDVAPQNIPNGHCIAVRITAENPDAGFKPTSGSIQELTFRSSPTVWGYFSVQGSGSLHEFADSQFGHLFGWGETREDARKSVVMALKEMSIRGDIRTPIEYLIFLLESDDFRSSNIHTGWLDGLIQNHAFHDMIHKHDVLDTISIIICGATWRAFQLQKSRKDAFIQYLERGQVPPPDLLRCKDEVELIYNNTKFQFVTLREGKNSFSIESTMHQMEPIHVDVQALSDGGLLLVFDGKSHHVHGSEEPLGLRLVIGGKTCTFEREYDPTNLRCTTTGKLVRHLVKDGTHVNPGQAFAEIEVMKMYMPVLSPEAGTIFFEKSEGSVLAAGDTIARLDLDDPSSVRKAKLYDQDFPLMKPPRATTNKINKIVCCKIASLSSILYGYHSNDVKAEVHAFMDCLADVELPLLEFEECISNLVGRLPKTVELNIVKILNSYRSGVLAHKSAMYALELAFPSRPIREVLDKFQAELPLQERASFATVADPIFKLVDRYTEGYKKFVFTQFIKEYLEVEKIFQNRQRNDAILEMRQKYKTDLNKVFDLSLSRNPLSKKHELILAILSIIEKKKTTEDFVALLHDLASLTGKDSIDVSVKARQLLIRFQLPSFKQRQVAIEENLRNAHAASGTNRDEILLTLIDQAPSLFDVLISFLKHPNPDLQRLALEVYVKRSYRAYDIRSFESKFVSSHLCGEWRFIMPDGPASSESESTLAHNFASNLSVAPSSSSSSLSGSSSGMKRSKKSDMISAESIDDLYTLGERALEAETEDSLRYGMMVVFKNLTEMSNEFEKVILQQFAPVRPFYKNEPVNVLNICLLEDHTFDEKQIGDVEDFFKLHEKALFEKGLRRITLALGRGTDFPEYYTFRARLGYQEDGICRHIEPPLAYHLELRRMSNFNFEYVPTLNRKIHLYYATEKTAKPVDPSLLNSCFFIRAVVRSGDTLSGPAYNEYLVSQAEKVLADSIKSLEVAIRNPAHQNAQNHHIFMKILTEANYEPEGVDLLLRTLGQKYGKRLWKLKVGQLEVSGRVRHGKSVSSLRFIVRNPTGYHFEIEGFLEVKDAKTNTYHLQSLTGPSALDGMNVYHPYPIIDKLQQRRFVAQHQKTTYVYDIPTIMRESLSLTWKQHKQASEEIDPANKIKVPERLLDVKELVLVDNDTITETERPAGENSIGMVAWRMKLFTPEYPEGRDAIVIANDITTQIGSFGPLEDYLFKNASELARKLGIPRIYIACNSGARIGLAREVQESFKVEWVDPNDISKGFRYLYLDEADYQRLAPHNSVLSTLVQDEHTKKYRITDIIGAEDGLSVENLRGSGMIAGETSIAYHDIFTITLVTGRTVGIGAYLVRLGQRTIQSEAPIILTGAAAINKLLGKEVYSSNVQLGGLQIMFRNGVSHIDVVDDFRGMQAILRWLSYTPKHKNAPLKLFNIGDPVERDIDVFPTPTPYNPVEMLTGKYDSDGTWCSGFFDRHSFTETLAGWAKTVICGRARLGGLPIGVICVETRTVENMIPADPANPESTEVIQMQAGQVWFPDSAYKTAQAIKDFNHGEELPLIIFANWRGFSGGMRDMFDEILKFGSYIVDNLVDYKQPVFIYIPPYGELRGGAWVVLDPTINIDVMEMFCDELGCGGVLEPSGTVEIKFRDRDIKRTMHRIDHVLIDLDKQLAQLAQQKGAVSSSSSSSSSSSDIEEQKKRIISLITNRERLLLPTYQQVALKFAELHDTPGRMKAKGVISEVLQWKRARSFFFHRLRRRLAEHEIRKSINAQGHCSFNNQQVREFLTRWMDPETAASDQKAASWLENPANFAHHIQELRLQTTVSKLASLMQGNEQIFQQALSILQQQKQAPSSSK